ncbi:hypothetical protein acsn021_33880 [Anaerocolumna cellulosilytica]|uniref:Uncharacterized protein n=1 Tax=Anaerocolumna cellulosilytica TaxID=433286 RepID=A0A6S6R396_9FIRM|nr:hypothetical protein [Anaerocolumna cellulosilytica]MBB5196787.1 flagellar hook assembly protein FlgD [Anaerocolumna cellulosilytica]BCJ95819.1 hypothetical protein acsn021_33880 [Anaerocolumna cellulosilytica]
MRKKKIGIYIGILLVLSSISYYIWNTSTLLAEIHKNVKQTEVIARESGFKLNYQDEVKVFVKSSIKEGSALITLQSENGETLYTFKTDCSQKETFSLEAGNYKIRIDGENSKGKFDIVVRK